MVVFDMLVYMWQYLSLVLFTLAYKVYMLNQEIYRASSED